MKIRLVIILLLMLAAVGAYAQDSSAAQLFQSELHSKNEQVNSIECKFRQTREVSVLANAVTKEGVFHFSKPCNMLLAFNDGDYIKMDGELFEMKNGSDVASTKVSANPMLRNLNTILSACVVGDFNKMSNGFSVNYEESASEWIITLVPQRAKAASKISRIVIRFDKGDMSLNLLKMEEKSGDYTEYSFFNKKFNVKV